MREHIRILRIELGYLPGASWRKWDVTNLRLAQAWVLRAGRFYLGLYRRRQLLS